jgi:ABC-2 type transport system ATP-binding protein
VRERIGLSGQNAAVDEHLTGYENLDMVGRLYHLGRARSRTRAHELLDQFELSEVAGRPVKTYSGGRRRRLDLAAALVAEPDVLFLDEPTTGLDPRSRLQMWGAMQELVRGGATVLLTTQYMEEADRLADEIVVVDRGRIIANGTPEELKALIGGERVELIVANPAELPQARTAVAELSQGEVQVDEQSRTLTAAVTGGLQLLTQLLDRLGERSIGVVDVGLRRPTLDDVFLSLTGHTAEQVAEADDDGGGEPGAGYSSDREKESVL